MEKEIELGKYECGEAQVSGALKQVISTQYKIVVDGTQEEILVHEQNDCFIDGNNRQWTKI